MNELLDRKGSGMHERLERCLRDTAQMRTQYPEWLLREMEAAADAIEELRKMEKHLRDAAQRTLDDNGHLADGEVCTLIHLKRALRSNGGNKPTHEVSSA